jgi:hypothetical protein
MNNNDFTVGHVSWSPDYGRDPAKQFQHPVFQEHFKTIKEESAFAKIVDLDLSCASTDFTLKVIEALSRSLIKDDPSNKVHLQTLIAKHIDRHE